MAIAWGSDKARHKRTSIVWFHLFEHLRIGKFIEGRRREVSRVEMKIRSCCLLSIVSGLDVQKVLVVNSGDGYMAM
jgi:hypothetical protein